MNEPRTNPLAGSPNTVVRTIKAWPTTAAAVNSRYQPRTSAGREAQR